MNVKEVIKKAKQAAKTTDELLLPTRFEAYLELLEQKKQGSQEERALLEVKIQESLLSLKEVADRISTTYGIDPDSMIEFFMNPMNVDPNFTASIEGIQFGSSEIKRSKLPKRNNKKLKV